MVKLTHFDINQITPFSIGFDRVFDRLVDYGTTYEQGGFPPYNIRKTEDFKHVIEIALAGIDKKDLNVEIQENTLTVSYQSSEEDTDKKLYKGIAQRSFRRQFSLAEDVEVTGASFKKQIVPEHKKPRNIKVK